MESTVAASALHDMTLFTHKRHDTNFTRDHITRLLVITSPEVHAASPKVHAASFIPQADTFLVQAHIPVQTWITLLLS